MQKSEFIENLQQDLGRDPELLRACEAVVDQLEKLNPSEWRHISFGMLSRAAGVPDVVDAIPIAQYLASSRSKLLQRCYMLIAGDEEFEMDDQVIEEAFRTHVLYHPDRGEPLSDFEKMLHVYFTVSDFGKIVLGKST